MLLLSLVSTVLAWFCVLAWRFVDDRRRELEAERRVLLARDAVRQSWLDQARELLGDVRFAGESPDSSPHAESWHRRAGLLLRSLEHRREARPVSQDPPRHAADVRIVAQRLSLGLEVPQ